MFNIVRILVHPKRVVAMMVLFVNFILLKKMFEIEYRWYRAHRRIWPLLVRQRKPNEPTRTLQQMLDDEALDRQNLNWAYWGTYHLIPAVHGTEHRGTASIQSKSDNIDNRVIDRLKDRIEKNVANG